jgi:hypothetical protein
LLSVLSFRAVCARPQKKKTLIPQDFLGSVMLRLRNVPGGLNFNLPTILNPQDALHKLRE